MGPFCCDRLDTLTQGYYPILPPRWFASNIFGIMIRQLS